MAQNKLKQVERNLYLDLDTGIYQVRAMVGGKAYGPISTYCTTLKMALRKRDEIMVELRQREDKAKEVPTLAAYWKDYRERKDKSSLTWKHQDGLMDQHVLPVYGSERLNDFTGRQFEFYIQKRRKAGAKDSTIALELKVIAAVFADAVENGIIDRNPVKKVVKEGPKITGRKRVLTEEEQDKIEAVAVPEARRFILFLLATGIRLGEAARIKPSRDFRWEEQEFHVIGKGNKERWVPILAPEVLKLIVDEQLALTGTEALWTRAEDPLREMVYHACDMAGVTRVSPHVLRHTFATRYLRKATKRSWAGNIYTLSLILGHSSVKVTEETYAHLKPRDLVELSADVEVGVRYKGARD